LENVIKLLSFISKRCFQYILLCNFSICKQRYIQCCSQATLTKASVNTEMDIATGRNLLLTAICVENTRPFATPLDFKEVTVMMFNDLPSTLINKITCPRPPIPNDPISLCNKNHYTFMVRKGWKIKGLPWRWYRENKHRTLIVFPLNTQDSFSLLLALRQSDSRFLSKAKFQLRFVHIDRSNILSTLLQ
jgi:hypothetical protein